MKQYFTLYILIFLLSNQGLAQLPSLKIGAEKGVASIGGEVNSATGFGLGFFIEKPIYPALSIRLYGAMGSMRGQDLNPTQNWINHPSWNGTINPLVDYRQANPNFIYANYQTNYLEASFQGKLTFTQLPFLNNQSNFDAFLLAGIGLMQFESKVDAIDNTAAIYDFNTIPFNPLEDLQILASLSQIQDGQYETLTQGGQQPTPLYQIGAGLEWRVHPSVSLSLTYRYSWTNTDVLDSYQWNENNVLNGVNDTQHFTSIGLSYVFSKKEPQKAAPVPIDIPTTPVELITQPKAELSEVEVPKDSIRMPQLQEVKIVELDKRDAVVLRRAFDNLEFETDQAIIRSISYVPLNELARLLADHPEWKLKISGHTDNTGDPAFNMDLSKRLAGRQP